MKRHHEPDEDSDSSQSFQDVISQAYAEADQYGVSWCFFEPGQTRTSRTTAFQAMKTKVASPEVQEYYIGVCKSPAHRFYNEPAPHKLRFDAIFPLLVGQNMGKTEKNYLQVLRAGQVDLHKLMNKSGGGEGVHARSVRFLYFCVKWTRPEAV